eukprot:2744550-Rhodomonas_salina.2
MPHTVTIIAMVGSSSLALCSTTMAVMLQVNLASPHVLLVTCTMTVHLPILVHACTHVHVRTCRKEFARHYGTVTPSNGQNVYTCTPYYYYVWYPCTPVLVQIKAEKTSSPLKQIGILTKGPGDPRADDANTERYPGRRENQRRATACLAHHDPNQRQETARLERVECAEMNDNFEETICVAGAGSCVARECVLLRCAATPCSYASILLWC